MDSDEHTTSSDSDSPTMGNAITSGRLVRLTSHTYYRPEVTSDEDSESLPELTFDKVLPSEHTYLGNDMEVLSGRTFLDDGCYHSLVLLPPSGVVLVPGQTLPLTVADEYTVAMLRHCISNDRTFGVIASWSAFNNHSDELVDVGTTAEIYEYRNQENAGFRIKAKARQRFKVCEMYKRPEGFYVAKVCILPEIILPDALFDVRSASLNRHRGTHPIRCRKRDAIMTGWPTWVYDQYETSKLISRVENELTFLQRGCDVELPKDPTELSFWVAQNLPIEQRLVVLQLNSPIQRLRWELSVLQKCQTLMCTNCDNVVGHQKDVFAMSVEGPQGTFVNPEGYLHETITLSRAQGMSLVGRPSTTYSWFPGYSWTSAYCRHCRYHLGWKFIATKEEMSPIKFWGLSRRSLKVKINMDSDEKVLHVI